MPYSNRYDQIEYNHMWYLQHQDEHIKTMTQYYYDNRAKILSKIKSMIIIIMISIIMLMLII